MKKIFKEVILFSYVFFLFCFMVGIFTFNFSNQNSLLSTWLTPSSNLFSSITGETAGIFLFFLGKAAYFLLFPFFIILVASVFNHKGLLKAGFWIILEIIWISCFFGIFSTQDEIIQGGILGNMMADALVPMIGVIPVSIILAIIMGVCATRIFPLFYYYLDKILQHKIKSMFYDEKNKSIANKYLNIKVHNTEQDGKSWSSIENKDILLERKEDILQTVDPLIITVSEYQILESKIEIKDLERLKQLHLENGMTKIEDLIPVEEQEGISSLDSLRLGVKELLKEQELVLASMKSVSTELGFTEIHKKEQTISYSADSTLYRSNLELEDFTLFREEKTEFHVTVMDKEEIKEDKKIFHLEDIEYKENQILHTIQDENEEEYIKARENYFSLERGLDSEYYVEDMVGNFEHEYVQQKETLKVNDSLEMREKNESENTFEMEEQNLEKKEKLELDVENISKKDSKEEIIPVLPQPKNSSGNPYKQYEYPHFDLLKSVENLNLEENDVMSDTIADLILEVLKEFNIEAILEEIIVGPVVTRYEIRPPKGLKVSKITDLADNIALSLASKDKIRIEAPVYGKSVVGIEVPNKIRQVVTFKDLAKSYESHDIKKNFHLPFLLGKGLDGQAVLCDIVKMPHLLIAGSTGAGKSVCVNTLINSLLFYKTPEEVKLILIDPKRVELILYDNLPHLITPVIKETHEAIRALKWLVHHMEERYATLEEVKVRNIVEYNIIQKQNGNPIMPYIVLVMDEFADLILLGKRDLEESVIRLAAMARAVGIHLVLATQRPSADVITGLIKANFASRIAFRVSSKMESRIILDENGAENLLGKGDMLFMSSEKGGVSTRIQAPFISDEEVRDISTYFKEKYSPDYWDGIFEEEDSSIDESSFEEEPLFKEAVEIVLKDQKASASYLQRRLKIGYNRAARLIEMMEDMGIISKLSGAKPRDILVDSWN